MKRGYGKLLGLVAGAALLRGNPLLGLLARPCLRRRNAAHDRIRTLRERR